MFYILTIGYKNMEYFINISVEKADKLSRRPDYKIETVNNNKSKIIKEK